MRDVDNQARMWNELASNEPLTSSYPRLDKFRKSLTPEFFEKLCGTQDAPTKERTNNAAERAARRFKKFQKTKYRIRNAIQLERFISLDEQLRASPLEFSELETRSVLID